MAGAGGAYPAEAAGGFFLCDIFDAIPKNDLASMEHPLFSLATRPDRRILNYEHNGAEITVVPSVKGLATIHDKDILIFCISQLMAAQNAGRQLSRTLHLKAHDLLTSSVNHLAPPSVSERPWGSAGLALSTRRKWAWATGIR